MKQMRWFLLPLLLAAISTVVHAGQDDRAKCEWEALALPELIRIWGTQGTALLKAQEFEIRDSDRERRIVFLFPTSQAVDTEIYRAIQGKSLGFLWRSSRDFPGHEGGLASAHVAGKLTHLVGAMSARNDLSELLKEAGEKKFLLGRGNFPRPIIEILYDRDTPMNGEYEHIRHSPATLAHLAIRAKEPAAILLWGSEWMPDREEATLRIFEGLVSSSAEMTARHVSYQQAHAAPLGIFTEESVFPTAQTVLTRQANGSSER